MPLVYLKFTCGVGYIDFKLSSRLDNPLNPVACPRY